MNSDNPYATATTYGTLGQTAMTAQMGGPADRMASAKSVQGAYLVPSTSPVSYDVLVLSKSGNTHATLKDAYGDCAVQYAEYQCQK